MLFRCLFRGRCLETNAVSEQCASSDCFSDTTVLALRKYTTIWRRIQRVKNNPYWTKFRSRELVGLNLSTECKETYIHTTRIKEMRRESRDQLDEGGRNTSSDGSTSWLPDDGGDGDDNDDDAIRNYISEDFQLMKTDINWNSVHKWLTEL
jgi:hypothetical protein